MSRSENAREALEVLGKSATNKEIREYVKDKYDIDLKGNELWRVAGSQRDRKFKEVTYEELVNVNRDAKRYGSISRLSVVAQAAEMKATR